jgi:hypothetical protein
MKDQRDEAALVLIGDDEQRSPRDLVGETAAATVIALDQQLYEERHGEPWTRGDRVGEAHGIAVTTHGGRVVCSFTFELEGDDSIAMHGVLPLDGGSIGSGRMAITGGTGRFHHASGTVRVEHRNPKRYRLILS